MRGHEFKVNLRVGFSQYVMVMWRNLSELVVEGVPIIILYRYLKCNVMEVTRQIGIDVEKPHSHHGRGVPRRHTSVLFDSTTDTRRRW